MVREEDFHQMVEKMNQISKKIEALTDQEKPMNVKAASEFLDCSTKDIYRKVQQDSTFPYHKYGSTYRFFASELIEWLRDK